MTIITVVITIMIVGIGLWLINTYVPMAAPIKKILNGLVILCLIAWLLSIFGLLGPLMPFLNVIIALIIVGAGLWFINSYIPMAASIKTILNIVVIVCVIVWLLNVFGLIGSVSHLGHLH